MEYDDANTRKLPYAEYAKFMSAVHSCGVFLQDARLRTLKQETEEEHNQRGTQPLPPTPQLQPIPQIQPTQPAAPTTTVRALLAKVRALLDELEKAQDLH
jgi:hypothetical protein